MKKVVSFILIAVFCFTVLCACGSDNDSNSGGNFKMTTAYAAEQMVEEALNEWMSTKLLSLECTEFKYNILKTERSELAFGSDAETGMMWYDAYGTVTFYNDYGDTLKQGSFKVTFGHNGDHGLSLANDKTIVDLS